MKTCTSTSCSNSHNYCQLINIQGLCNPEDVNDVINRYPYWKQIYLTETLTLPDQKPDIEVLNSLDISVEIMKSYVIRTPRSFDDTGLTPIPVPNLEGNLLTGRKLIVEGALTQQVDYTANYPSQPVHSAHFYVPFSSYIVVPEEITFAQNNGNTIDSLQVTYEVNACIEDVAIKALDERTILKQVTLLLYAVPTQV